MVTGHLAELGVLRCVPLVRGLHLALDKQKQQAGSSQVASFKIQVGDEFFGMMMMMMMMKSLLDQTIEIIIELMKTDIGMVYDRNGIIFCDLELLVVAPSGSI